MKKLLYILLTLDIIGIIVMFFTLLAEHTFLAFLSLVCGALGLVPLIALIHCIDCIEQQSSDISYLYFKLKSLEKEQGLVSHPLSAPNISIKHNDSPKKTWKCTKCGTVNKPNDNICSGCNSEYAYYDQTFDSEPKRKSRFVKFK